MVATGLNRGRRRLTLLAALLLVLAAGGGRAAAAGAGGGRVVVLLVDGLSPADLGAFPSLSGRAALGLANVLTASTTATEVGRGPDQPGDQRAAAGAATLGAGARARAPVRGWSVAEAGGGLLLTDLPAWQQAQVGLGYAVDLGALGDAAEAAGSCAAAYGGPTALLAAMDGGGAAGGRLGPLPEPAAVVASPCRLVVVADPGVAAAREPAARRAALAAADRLAGGLAAALRPSDLLLVASPSLPPALSGRVHLSPFWLVGGGWPPGLAFSPSTRVAGVATLPDLTATVADRLAAPVPAGVLGRPLRAVPAQRPAERLADLFARVSANRLRRNPLIRLGAGLDLVAWVGAVLALATRRLPLALVHGALIGASGVPLAYLALAAAPLAAPVPAAALVLAAAGLIAAAGARLEAWRRGAGYGAVGAVTAAAVVVDLGRGGPWMQASPLGFSYDEGARFYGLGNEYAGVLLGSALVAAGAAADLLRGRRWLRPALVAGGLLVAAATGLPQAGANFGCLLGAVAGGGAALARGRRGRAVWRDAAAVAAAAALAAAAVVAVDLGRGPLGSHVALAAVTVARGGGGALLGIVGRKLAMNLRLIRFSIWSGLLTTSLGCFWLLTCTPLGGYRRLSRARPGLAAALVGVAVGGLVNLLVNDSGVVAAATTTLYGSCALLGALAEGVAAGGAARGGANPSGVAMARNREKVENFGAQGADPGPGQARRRPARSGRGGDLAP